MRLLAIGLQSYIFSQLILKAGLSLDDISTWLLLISNILLMILYSREVAQDVLNRYIRENDLEKLD